MTLRANLFVINYQNAIKMIDVTLLCGEDAAVAARSFAMFWFVSGEGMDGGVGRDCS